MIRKLMGKFAFLAIIVGIMAMIILNYVIPYMHA
ncbi:MAG: hypothetical protein PWQ75_439 [Methanolobus sp.]|jgi:hypothetical protein|nr:hypothetical protein [Methanolobus sp.]